MKDIRLNRLAKLLVHYSTGVKPGDFVYVRCDEVATPWAVEVVSEAVKAGGHVEYVLDSDDIDRARLSLGTEAQLKEENHMMKHMMERADVWLTAWAARNTKTSSGIPADKIRYSAQGQSSWRKLYSERVGNGTLRWCGTQFPTYADAQEASMSLDEYEDFVYGAGHLDKDDPVAEWRRISAEQEKWVRYLDTKRSLRIVSVGTDITVGIAGRKWINCDGRENFPDGEIFTSPLDDATDGYITFSFPGIYAGRDVEGIRLQVEAGRVVRATADKGEELLLELLRTDEGAGRFGEVAIGTNYNIRTFTRNMLFDEKIGGTVHLALGDSMPEAGGKNSSVIHWDMLCDMRAGGKIYADGVLFYENGTFIHRVLDE